LYAIAALDGGLEPHLQLTALIREAWLKLAPRAYFSPGGVFSLPSSELWSSARGAREGYSRA